MPCDPHSAIIITRKAAANARCRFSFLINEENIARTISKEFNNVENTTQGAFVPNSDIPLVLVRIPPANGFGPSHLPPVNRSILRFWRDIASQWVTEIGVRPAILRRVHRPPGHHSQR